MKNWKMPSKTITGHMQFAVSFSTTEILVLEEVYIYPLLSCISEMGGALGLFLGFSFLMIWDSISNCFGVLHQPFGTK